MIVKIELIILSVIAILSFVTGVVINIVDIYREKDILKNNKHPVDDDYEKRIINQIMKNNPDLEDKTIVDINIPKVKEKIEFEMPVIIQSYPTDEDKK